MQEVPTDPHTLAEMLAQVEDDRLSDALTEELRPTAPSTARVVIEHRQVAVGNSFALIERRTIKSGTKPTNPNTQKEEPTMDTTTTTKKRAPKKATAATTKRATTPGNRRNAKARAEALDTSTLDPDALAAADALVSDAAASSMAPQGLDHYSTAEYAECAALVDALAARLIEQYEHPKITATTYAAAMSSSGVQERVSLDLWTQDRVLQMHDHHASRSVNMATGEVRKFKTYHRRWNNTDDRAGSITVGDVTFMLCDDHDQTDAHGTYLVHLIAAPHQDTMFYEMNGKRYPYLGQYVAKQYADRPGAGNQRAFMATVRILALMSPATALATSAAWLDAKRAAYRMAEIEQEADRAQVEQHQDAPKVALKPKPERNAHAEAMRLDVE